MKKNYTLFILAIVFSLKTNAQLATALAPNGDGILFNDNSKSHLYLYKANFGSINVSKLTPPSTTFSLVTTFNTNNSVFGGYSLGAVKAALGSKFVITMNIGPFNASTTKFFAYNGTSIDTLLVTNTLEVNTQTSQILLTPTVAYLSLRNKIYKSNYTAATTSLIATAQSTLNQIILTTENNGNLYWFEETNGNYTYFKKYEANTVAKVDSANYINSENLSMYNDTTTKTIYFMKVGNQSTVLKKIDANGVSTQLYSCTSFTNPCLKAGIIMGKINNSLYLSRPSGGIIKYDLATNTTSLLKTVTSNSNNAYPNYTPTQYAGRLFPQTTNNIYFEGVDTITNSARMWVTNGTAVKQISGCSTCTNVSYSSNIRGAFCGEDLWFALGENSLFKKVFIAKADGTSDIENLAPILNYTVQGVSSFVNAGNKLYFRTADGTASLGQFYVVNSCSAPLQVGINENIISTDNFSIYPNPSAGVLNVELSANFDYAQLPLIITNILGEVVLTEKLSTQHSSLNIQHFNSGIYFLQVGSSKALKFIKE